MLKRRSGYTLLEIILIIAVIALLIGGTLLWLRVEKLNDWAVAEQAWSAEVHKWIKSSTFEQGPYPGGADPDGVKPPAPPEGL